MSSWDPSIKTNIDPFIDLVLSGNFSEAGKLLFEKAGSEKGFLLAIAIQQIGNSLNSALEAGKISLEGRAKVQYLALSLAQQAITHELESLQMPVESSLLFNPVSSSLNESTRAIFYKIVTDHAESLTKVLASGYDKEKAGLIINISEKTTEIRVNGIISTQEALLKLMESSRYDPKVLIKVGEHLPIVLREMNETAKVLLEQDLDKINQMSENLKNCIRIAFLDSLHHSQTYIARTEHE